MKKEILLVVLVSFLASFTSCNKEAIAVKATIMEYGDTEECRYVLILKDEFNGERWYIPSNLPNDFKTYQTKDVLVSFKLTNASCDCYPSLGDFGNLREDLKETIEKIKIIDIE